MLQGFFKGNIEGNEEVMGVVEATIMKHKHYHGIQRGDVVQYQELYAINHRPITVLCTGVVICLDPAALCENFNRYNSTRYRWYVAQSVFPKAKKRSIAGEALTVIARNADIFGTPFKNDFLKG